MLLFVLYEMFFLEGHPGRLNSSELHFYCLKKYSDISFSGEPKWIVLSRGALAASIIIVITIFACYNVVLETVRQAAWTPVSNLRGGGIPWDFTMTQAPVWNVIFVRRIFAFFSYY